ncbi:sel1 repeat family protein [Pseudorhodoferax sp.]|uniref:sel1 repeat family protein n=1 Tax=Pseudorhodoferax sp. TaxID=1993553 RepID=UPI002DD68E7F|nr:sel1 repeat family protein [Pseudorhodoferax sp.]
MPIRPTLLAACAALLLNHAAAATPEQLYQLALEAQSARAYPQMLDLLRQSARAGNVEAQEMLGLALLAGPAVYGPAVPADRCEATHWVRQAFAQGSLVAWQQLVFLNRARTAAAGQRPCSG